jgi:hypothetical protein
MKGITTLAALPSGAGQAAALPAEVGEERKWASGGYVTPSAWKVIPQVRPPEGVEAFTPFSTVTAIDQSPESIARLVEVTSPVKYEMRECVMTDDPTTLFLTRGHARAPGAPIERLSDACFAEFRRVVTIDEKIAQQLSDAGYSLSMWMDVRVGMGWEVSK